MTNGTWREATRADDERIHVLCKELYVEDPSPYLVSPEQLDHTLHYLRKNPSRGRPIVLQVNGQVQGYALLIYYWSNELGGESCNIDEIYIRPDFRGQGYARTLVENIMTDPDLKARPLAAIALEVSPLNSRARELYSKLGFKPARNTHMRLLIK